MSRSCTSSPDAAAPDPASPTSKPLRQHLARDPGLMLRSPRRASRQAPSTTRVMRSEISRPTALRRSLSARTSSRAVPSARRSSSSSRSSATAHAPSCGRARTPRGARRAPRRRRRSMPLAGDLDRSRRARARRCSSAPSADASARLHLVDLLAEPWARARGSSAPPSSDTRPERLSMSSSAFTLSSSAISACAVVGQRRCPGAAAARGAAAGAP